MHGELLLTMTGPQTISRDELLRYCGYELDGMSQKARSMTAVRLRRRYGISAIQGPTKGLRYSREEVKRKITFTRINP